MSSNVFLDHPYLLIAFVAFFINIPFGYIRENCPKFSASWVFWIHASIPLLIYLRITLGTSTWFIPVSIFFAILGQVVGSRWRRKTRTQSDLEKLEQIPDLQIPSTGKFSVNDSEVAIVLLNMGGPETIQEVRPFLKRLFMDRRIIRFPLSSLLQGVFANLIVAARAKVTEHRYGLIGGGSPLLQSCIRQANALQEALRQRSRNITTTICFNYSRPLPQEVVAQLKNAGKKVIVALSLYPHYSEATTGSNRYYLKKEVQRQSPQTMVMEAKPYFLDDQYITAFCDRILEQIQKGESLDDFYIVFSAHGLPLYYLTNGDPYPFQIAQTVCRVLDRLNRKDRWVISYQSAVGPFQWLKPSTDSIIKALADRHQNKILIVPIAFVNDHIETICEIDIEYRAMARNRGIVDFRMSRALECHPAFISALADCVERTLNKPKELAVVN